MKTLGKITTLPCEIIQLLATNERLQKLLLIDTNDINVADFEKWHWAKLIESDYMSIAPIVDGNITNNSRNTFLIVHLDDIDSYGWEDNIEISGSVFIGTNLEHVWLQGNKLRLLEMIDEIMKTLDNYKFSVAGKMTVYRASSVVYANKSFGYRVFFKIKEQENKGVEL